MDISKIHISKYRNTFDHTCEEISVLDELNIIRSGVFKNNINHCRYTLKNGNKSEYKLIKTQLPAVTFSGTFTNQRTLHNLKNYTGIIVFDVDNLESDKVEITKQNIFKDDFVIACWGSPSGLGIKFLVGVDSQVGYHKEAFEQFKNHFENIYCIQLDKTGSDVTRLCYTSYDDKLLLKEKFILFSPQDVNESSNLVHHKSSQKNFSESLTSIIKNNSSELFKTEGKNKRSDKILIKKIIKYLKKIDKSITSNYNDWYHIALAIANCFTYDLGKDYFLELCRLDKDDHDEYKSIKLLEYCYYKRREGEINFATIVFKAQEKGFILK